MNPGVASVQIMQVGSPVAARIVSMAMRAIHHEQMLALCLHRLSVPEIVSQSERWSKTKRNSTHISRCAQIDNNRVHFSDFRLKFIRASLGRRQGVSTPLRIPPRCPVRVIIIKPSAVTAK
jgi:hypothetical protein